MRIGFQPRRPGVGVAAAVLALHLMLALVLLGARTWPDRQVTTPTQPLEVRLIVLAPRAEVARPSPERVRPTPSPQPRHTPQSITQPAAQAPPPAEQEPSVVPGAAVESSAAPALRLELPRAASAPQRWRHPAQDDPRANSPRHTLEAMIAGTMRGDDRLIEQALGDGRVRYRRGSECIVAHPARGAQIDPFNQSASPTPRLLESC